MADESIQAVWDRFIDALDRAGQAGSAADVEVPAGVASVSGRRFGEVTRDELKHLIRRASDVGRRGETIKVLWEDTQRRLRASRKRAKEDSKEGS